MVINNANSGAGGLRVLIVDDNPAVRSYLGELLSSWGYTTMMASCGEEALDALTAREAAELPALAIVDVVLGSENGVKLAAVLQGRAAHLRVLLISGYADNIVTLGAAEQERTFFLAKTFSPSQLKDALAAMKATGFPG